MRERDSRIIKTNTDYLPVLHEDGSFGQAEILSVLAWGFAGDRDLAAYQAVFIDEGAMGKFTKEFMTLQNGQKMRQDDAKLVFPGHEDLITEKWRR